MDLSPHLELSCNVNCHGVIVLIHMCIALYLFLKIFFQVITFTVCRSAILLPKFCDMFSYAEINISHASNVWLYRWLVCARAFFIFCVGWAVFFTRPFVCVCVCACVLLVMRVQGSLRVVLNTMIWPNMLVERSSQRSVRISAIDAEDGIKIYLIQVRVCINNSNNKNNTE